MNGFSFAAKCALASVLLCSSITSVWADDQPILPSITWKSTTGSSASFATPEAAFAAYQRWLVKQGITKWFVDDLRVCTDAEKREQPGFTYKYNGFDVYYCWTLHNADGSDASPAGDIVMQLKCPPEKPTMVSRPRIPMPQPANVTDYVWFCMEAKPLPKAASPKPPPSGNQGPAPRR